MLARTYRFKAYNGTGQAIAQNGITVKARRWRWLNGAKSYEDAEGSPYTMSAASLGSGAYHAGGTVDNSLDKWDGGDFEFTAISPTSANGDVKIYYETSTDGGDTWPDNGLGTPVATLTFTSSGTKVAQFSL